MGQTQARNQQKIDWNDYLKIIDILEHTKSTINTHTHTHTCTSLADGAVKTFVSLKAALSLGFRSEATPTNFASYTPASYFHIVTALEMPVEVPNIRKD